MSNHIRGLILCAAGSLCWSISGIAGQFLLEDKSFIPSQLTTVRMIGAGLLLLVWEWFSERGCERAVQSMEIVLVWCYRAYDYPVYVF